jgi:hypothetical protein
MSSWIDKISSEFIITTGDSKQFKPLWLNATRSFEYNISEFEFPNLSGTLVKRLTPKGMKYALEIYFEGEDHLDQSEAFLVSSRDQRPWKITHPLYGSLIVQPIGLSFDNTLYNVSKITGTVIETITEDNPKTSINPIDNITLDKAALDETFVTAIDTTPSATDINTMAANNNKLYATGVKAIALPEEAEIYFNLFNKANTAIVNATSGPLTAIRALQAVINAPALFTIGAKTRVDLLTNSFNSLRANVSGITDKSSKQIYENNAGTLLSAQAMAAATPIAGDYGNKNSVLLVIEIIINNYNNYLLDLDSLQSANAGNTDSYIPDANAMISLNLLINYSIASLFTIALTSKQERTLILENDSNIIVITHRLYGLDPYDNNINELMKNNNFGMDHLLQIRKGTKIVYYI